MNIGEALKNKYSKELVQSIVDWVGASQKRFDELFSFFINGQSRIAQTASGPVSYCVQAHPAFIHSHFPALIQCLQNPHLHDAVKRNSVRLLQFVDIPEQYQGQIMDACFRYLENPREAVAIKASSLTVLATLAKQYPEIVPEVKLLIEQQLPGQSAAFIARAIAFLQQVAT